MFLGKDCTKAAKGFSAGEIVSDERVKGCCLVLTRMRLGLSQGDTEASQARTEGGLTEAHRGISPRRLKTAQDTVSTSSFCACRKGML